MQVIRCEGLTKRYGDTVAVDRLDLTIGGGQVFGFLGPNGSGKTTTMRMLLGLITPTAGRAWVNDRPLPDPDGLARIGAMIEEPAFHPWLTGRRTLDVLALHGPPPRRRDAVAAALDRVGLSSVADRKVKGYSQGMRQRLGLAAALLRDPALLVLDEPTNGMDPAGIREFRALLRALADDGMTVFLSSHLLAEVEQVCDRVAVMNRGRLVEEGPVAELATVRRRVRVVLDEGDRDRAREVLAGRPARVDGPGTLLVEEADGREVNEALGRAGVWAREILVERPGLEEAFLTLTATEEDDRATPAR
ncbi:ABC transporter ATP-binding protein [Actinoallomurus rhizosphaericola]|uniref:ABC transporter ATP-binding protein n=1 Tax=Actinoallomurus rhizosphaericola TaxID=2952536 RepID=UPI002090BE07|nr:ABC transporter ATP-binding protein [Actinoallomurus rhizosphaericola]MCO5992006.1 ABC transporter ATP-binding protein [Actinoallomurus rhizosphaericola]